jgi:hypothetical protein
VIAWDYRNIQVAPLFCNESSASACFAWLYNFFTLYQPWMSDEEIYQWLTRRTLVELRTFFDEHRFTSLN